MKSNSYTNILKSVIRFSDVGMYNNRFSDVGMYNNRFQNVNVGN